MFWFFLVKNLASHNWIGFGIYNGNLGYKYGTSWSWFQTAIYLLGSFDKSRDLTWDFWCDFIFSSGEPRWIPTNLADENLSSSIGGKSHKTRFGENTTFRPWSQKLLGYCYIEVPCDSTPRGRSRHVNDAVISLSNTHNTETHRATFGAPWCSVIWHPIM